MRVTRKNIEKAIKDKFNLDVVLVKGDGYWWFASDGPLCVLDYAPTTTVYVMRLTDFSVERWVSEFEDLIEGVEVPEASDKNSDGTPKPIVLTGRVF